MSHFGLKNNFLAGTVCELFVVAVAAAAVMATSVPCS
jgi:hypothetical protein